MEATIQFKEKTNNAIIMFSDQDAYFTEGNSRFLLEKISLIRSTDKKPILESYCRMFPPKLKIILADGLELPFKMDGAQALKYSCEKNGNLYEVYQHKDRKHSIFKNNVQIAYFDKSEYAKFGADQYSLIADNGSDIELFLGFLLILHVVHGSSKTAIKSKDIGNVWEKRAFDINWKPK